MVLGLFVCGWCCVIDGLSCVGYRGGGRGWCAWEWVVVGGGEEAASEGGKGVSAVNFDEMVGIEVGEGVGGGGGSGGVVLLGGGGGGGGV